MVSDRSNGIYRSVVVALVGLAIVGTALFFLIRDLSSVDSAYRHSAADASIKYERDAKAYQKESCISSSSVLADPDCESKADEAKREGQRKEQDLAAQNITAWWTKIMGIAALIGMALSAIGVWLVKTTFDETRKSNEIAQQANRAWVTIEIEPTFVSISGKKCNVRCDLKFANMGNGVAVRFSYIATLKAKSGDEGEFVPDEFINIHVKNETPEVPNSKVTIVPRDCYVINAVCTDEYIGKTISGLKFLLTVSAFYKISDTDPVWRKSVRAFEITRKRLIDTRLKRTTFPPFTEHETLRTESLASQVKTGLLAT